MLNTIIAHRVNPCNLLCDLLNTFLPLKLFRLVITKGLNTVAYESIHPLGIFPILLSYKLELKWILEGGVASFDLHDMPTTLKMQNMFY
jgi:hypothetical protein